MPDVQSYLVIVPPFTFQKCSRLVDQFPDIFLLENWERTNGVGGGKVFQAEGMMGRNRGRDLPPTQSISDMRCRQEWC